MADAAERLRKPSRTGFAMRNYVLDGHTPVPIDIFTDDGMRRMGELFRDHEARVVKQEEVGPVFVSTVFLGIDHSFRGSPPVLFETMTFNPGGEHQWRYCTWDEAEEGHRLVVEKLTKDYAFQEKMMLWFGYPFRRRGSIL